MLTYPTKFEDLTNADWEAFIDCMKKPIIVKATQVTEPFRVKSLEGDYAQGKPGDYLMCGIMGELYICDKTIFEKSYDFLGEE